jgi:DNA-binding transcriptional LysR family regulator
VTVAESHPLAARSELTVADVLDETFPGVVDWCDPVWLGYWGLDAYRGSPARRTDDGAITPEEVASIVAAGRAITTVPELVAVPYVHLGIKAIPLIDADPAVLMLVWPDGAATPLVAELVQTARALAEPDPSDAGASRA